VDIGRGRYRYEERGIIEGATMAGYIGIHMRRRCPNNQQHKIYTPKHRAPATHTTAQSINHKSIKIKKASRARARATHKYKRKPQLNSPIPQHGTAKKPALISINQSINITSSRATHDTSTREATHSPAPPHGTANPASISQSIYQNPQEPHTSITEATSQHHHTGQQTLRQSISINQKS